MSQKTHKVRPIGRPSKYKREYCDFIKEKGRTGMTLEMIAEEIGVHRDSLKEWAAVHPEFSAAMRQAKQSQEVFMQKMGMKGMMGQIKGFVPHMWTFWMCARFGYRTSVEEEEEETELVFK